jgi:hypothetical protein
MTEIKGKLRYLQVPPRYPRNTVAELKIKIKSRLLYLVTMRKMSTMRKIQSHDPFMWLQ